MKDRKLLELAAKAARLNVEWFECTVKKGEGSAVFEGDYWNPLVDDGDALRLAVKLGIEIGNYHQYGRALAFIGQTRGQNEFWEVNVNDHCAATRRAIVRAAAKIGKAIP